MGTSLFFLVVHPGQLTWNLKIDPWNPARFRTWGFHSFLGAKAVHFGGCRPLKLEIIFTMEKAVFYHFSVPENIQACSMFGVGNMNFPTTMTPILTVFAPWRMGPSLRIVCFVKGVTNQAIY